MPTPSIILSPSREQLEEFFPTVGRLALDDQAKNELRSLAEVRALVQRALDPVMDYDGTTLVAAAPAEAQCNAMKLQNEWLQASVGQPDAAVGSAAWTRWFTARMQYTTTQEAEYFFRSVACAAHLTAVGLFQPGVRFAVIELAMHQHNGLAVEMSLNAYFLRRYPMIRFRALRFLTVFVHYDDLDREGVPRVSIDGYNVEANGSKF